MKLEIGPKDSGRAPSFELWMHAPMPHFFLLNFNKRSMQLKVI